MNLFKQTNQQDKEVYERLKLYTDTSAKNYSYCSGGYWCGHELLILNVASESLSVTLQTVANKIK